MEGQAKTASSEAVHGDTDEAVAHLAQLMTLQLAGDAVAFNAAVAALDEDGAKYILGAGVAVMAQACGDSLLAQLDA